MSHLPPAGTPGDQLGGAPSGGPGEPSEEEVRQYLAQMRATPAEQIVAEVLQGLLNAAQVKLGRQDARLLLDAAAELTERTAVALSDDLREQLDDVLAQLRMGQVQAEQEVASSGHDEVNDLDAGHAGDAPSASEPPGQRADDATTPSGRTARPSSDAQPGAAGGGGPGGGQGGGQGGASPLDKLWLPGR